MAAYIVDSEDGRYEVDPDTPKLAELISQLNADDNTFLVVLPDSDTPDWHASVTYTAGAYLVVRQDTRTGEDQKTTAINLQVISTDLKTWLDQRTNF